MKFIFIDEIEQSHKKPGFFAVSSLVVNSRFYEVLKDAVDEALEQAKWSREEEFTRDATSSQAARATPGSL